jgi:hypothetical protein
MSKMKLALWIAIVVLVGYLFISYFFSNDEKIIRGIIDDIQQAIMKENLDSTFDEVSLEFEDDNGFKYLPARFIVKSLFDQTDQINLRLPEININIAGKQATATLKLILTGYSGGNNHYILGSPDNPTMVDIGFKKGITGWKVIATRNIRPSKAYLRGENEEQSY